MAMGRRKENGMSRWHWFSFRRKQHRWRKRLRQVGLLWLPEAEAVGCPSEAQLFPSQLERVSLGKRPEAFFTRQSHAPTEPEHFGFAETRTFAVLGSKAQLFFPTQAEPLPGFPLFGSAEPFGVP